MTASLLIITFLYILISINFVLYSILEGDREGYYYHMKSLTDYVDRNLGEHGLLFTSQRLFVAVFMVLGILGIIRVGAMDIWDGVALLIGLWMLFPFIHDYSYYQTRNNLSPGVYPNGVFSQSTDSQSVIDNKKIGKRNISTPATRIVLFILGAIVVASALVHILLK